MTSRSGSDDPRRDDELVELVNAGDAEAFDVLYRRYRGWVLAVASRFCRDRDDALEVMQETFIYLLKRFPGFELRSKMTTYLYPVVRNLSMDTARRRQRRVAADEHLRREAAAEQARSAAAAEALPEANRGTHGRMDEDLAKVLEALPQAQREVVLLRFVDEMALGEIAEAMHVPVGTVKSRLHHALRTLRADPGVRRYFDQD